MKKIIFLTTILSACIFSGCKTQEDYSSEKVLKNVSSLFIINSSENDKENKDKWFELSKKSRSADETKKEVFPEDLSVSLKDIGIFTPAFSPEYPKAEKTSDASRSAEETSEIITNSYKKGDKKLLYSAEKIPFDSFFTQLRRFECIKEGEHCYIWVCFDEDSELILTEEEADSFAAKFDAIYERETILCGPKYDGTHAPGITGLIQPDDKISLIFNDIGEDFKNPRYGGYNSPSDMFMNNGVEMEAIHIDSYLAKTSPKYTYSAVAHEFNHKLNFDNKYIKYGLSMDLWYTEMLSLMTEDFFYEELGLTPADSSPARLYMFIKGSYEYGFKNWNRSNQTVELCDYANVYAFGSFLARNYGGAALIHEIATNEYVNEESVVKAVNKINNTNKTFKDLLKEFPAILINPYNTDAELPSLNKATNHTIAGQEFKLSKLNPKLLGDGSELTIEANDIDLWDFYKLGAYGFQFYSFDPGTDLQIRIENFLSYAAY